MLTPQLGAKEEEPDYFSFDLCHFGMRTADSSARSKIILFVAYLQLPIINVGPVSFLKPSMSLYIFSTILQREKFQKLV